MNDETVETYRRRKEPGSGREWTIASLIGAAALAWTLTSAWTGFRDGVLAELAACAYRHESLSALVERHYSERDPWIERIKLLERQREQLGERLQGALDRIRDLEHGKRP